MLRFHMGAGANYLKWKLTDPSGRSVFKSPDEVTMVLTNCRLRNAPSTAAKIYQGGNKSVCAWIEADLVVVIPKVALQIGVPLLYNPRVCPFWQVEGANGDNERFKTVMTSGRRLYAMAVAGAGGLAGYRPRSRRSR